MVYTFFDRTSTGTNTSGGAVTRAATFKNQCAGKSAIKNENTSNKQLADKLHKPIKRKFKKRRVYSFVKYTRICM